MTDLAAAPDLLDTVRDDVDELLKLTNHQTQVKGTVDTLRKRVESALSKFSAITGANVPIKIDGLGTVTYERAGDEEPYVTDSKALAEHLAQHRPSAVRAFIEVPAEMLDTCVSMVATVTDPKATVEAIGSGQTGYLAECEEIEGRFVHVDEEGQVVEVPGLSMRPGRSARVVVRPIKPKEGQS